MTYPVRIDRRVRVAMDDGVELALTVYLPESQNDGPYPAIVESVPYRKDDDCYARDLVTFSRLAAAGFAGVRIDIRGSGASDGVIVDEYPEREQLDTLEVLRWTAAQDWCTGKLGMWGISWGGFSALQTAMLRPPELGAIVPVHATHDRFACDVHYTGGALHLWEQVDWPVGMVATNGLPPDPDIAGQGWRETWLERLERTPQWLPNWLRHQHRDTYWLHGSPCADYSAITCPTLLIGGWLDGYVDGMLSLLEHLRCPRRAIIGPWGHYRPAGGVPGPTLDHFDAMAAWFGHWLRGDPNGVEEDPLLAVYVRTGPPYDPVEGDVPGHWRAEPAWPPADRTVVHHPLGGQIRTWTGPQSVGQAAAFWDTAGWGSTDTSLDDQQSVAIEFGPFTQPVEILGSPVAALTVSVDRPKGLVAVRLIDVDPDGVGHLITRGRLNLAHRAGLGSPASVPAEVPLEVEVPMRETSAVVQPGHRLRLAISGVDFPIAFPLPDEVALRLDLAKSYLRLPVVPPRPQFQTLDLPPAASWESPVETTDSVQRHQTTRSEGRTVVTRSVQHRERQPGRDDLWYSWSQDIEVSVEDHDPRSVRAWSRAETGLARADWSVVSTGEVSLTTNGGSYLLEISLEAWEGDRVMFARRWREEVPRTWT